MTEVSAAQTNKKWHDRVVVPYGQIRYNKLRKLKKAKK